MHVLNNKRKKLQNKCIDDANVILQIMFQQSKLVCCKVILIQERK